MRTLILTITIFTLLTLVGCSTEDTTTRPSDTPEEAPVLPPAASMQMDFGFFDNGQNLQLKNGAEGSGESLGKFNWLNAVVRVAYINLAVAQAFTPPTMAFAAAINTHPIIEAPRTFLWTYVWTESPEHEVIIHLRGRLETTHVVWTLRVTDDQATPPLDEFLWFHGESSLVDETGFWVFNDIAEGGAEREMARIDWSVEAEDQRELVFENIQAGHEEYGDTLTYLVEATIVSVRFHDESESIDADVTWDEITGAGSLRVPDYNDGERACWDENQDDVECPDEPS